MRRRMRTSGQIARLFYDADNNTIIRKPNLRRFARDSGVHFRILHKGCWLIDIDEFLNAVNPNQTDLRETMPRLRNIATSVILFNETHPQYRIDKHTVEKCMQSNTVFKTKHGNRWIINYDELEREMLNYLKFNK